MARVAGLTPVERSGSGATDRANQRSQDAPNRPAPDLNPKAAPVSIYSRPEDNTASAGNSLAQLSKALGSLNPALERYAATYTDEAKAQAEAEASNKIGGMTFEEAQKGVQEGTITELQNPWFKAAFMKQFGQRAALKKAEELQDTYSNKFNRESGDVEGLVAGTAKPVLDQYGNDRHFSAGFNGVFNGAANKVRTTQADYKAQRVATEVRQGVYEIGSAIISQGMSQGQTAEQIVGTLRSTYAGNKQLLNIPYQEQDAEVMRMAETLTKGISTSKNPQLQKEVVERLLNADRTAPDGKVLGPLSQNRLYADKAVAMLEGADKELRESKRKSSFDQHLYWDDKASKGMLDKTEFESLQAEHAANPGRFTDAQVLSLKHRSDAILEQRRVEAATASERLRVRQLADAQRNGIINDAATLSGNGNLWAARDRTYIDEHGNEKTFTADKQREEVVSNFVRRSREVAAARKEPPDVTFNREVDWFTANGEENPQWSALLKRGYIQGSASNLSGSKLPEGLEAASDLYNQLYAKSPSLLKKHIDSDSMDFYEAVRFGTQVAGFDKKTAALNALEVNKDPTKYESPYWKQKFDNIDQAVKGTMPGWLTNGAPDNAGEIAPQIEQAARYFSKLGASPQVAVAEAKKRVEANYVPINGYLVHTGDRAIPAKFPDMAKQYIDDYAKKFGEKEGVTASDLTVQPIGNAAGQWRIVHKKNPGMIVDHPEGIFDMPKLNDFETARVERERAAAMKKANDDLPYKLIAPFEALDREEEALNKSALGGAYRAARLKSIGDRRAKLGPRPATPPPRPEDDPASFVIDPFANP